MTQLNSPEPNENNKKKYLYSQDKFAQIYVFTFLMKYLVYLCIYQARELHNLFDIGSNGLHICVKPSKFKKLLDIKFFLGCHSIVISWRHCGPETT